MVGMSLVLSDVDCEQANQDQNDKQRIALSPSSTATKPAQHPTHPSNRSEQAVSLVLVLITSSVFMELHPFTTPKAKTSMTCSRFPTLTHGHSRNRATKNNSSGDWKTRSAARLSTHPSFGETNTSRGYVVCAGFGAAAMRGHLEIGDATAAYIDHRMNMAERGICSR